MRDSNSGLVGNPTAQRRAFVEQLADQNRAFYGTPDGRGMLRALELPFEHRWIYLFELVQNALDAGARSVAIHLDEEGDGLVFQHDGRAPLQERDVGGLSKIFRSTKGASSVGFMGIGFKSVFGRFREARVSGWGWTFRYEVPQVVGEVYQDIQLDLLGAVTPIWDDTIVAPQPEFTTRFGLARRIDPRADLPSDLAYFLPDDDLTPLAILAAAGLERLEVAGRVWELGVQEEAGGSLEATALSAGDNLLWQLFPVRFDPSPEAVARFLEHRRIQPTEDEQDRVYGEAARARQVLGVLPLDDQGVPNPPSRGRVYATLPTEVTLPFGIHVNADWLLNISRTGLREIEDNPWQRDIADRIADVLASLLAWVARTCESRESAKAAFGALALPAAEGRGRLEALLADDRWLGRLRAQLEDAVVLPVQIDLGDSLRFAKSSEVLVPPEPLADAFEEEPSLLPAILMKGPVLSREVLGSGAVELLSRVGLLREMPPSALAGAWAGGLEEWWQQLPGDDSARRDMLFRLWGAVAELATHERWRAADLPCIRTSGGVWLRAEEAAFFNETLPSDREPGGSESRELIESFLPDASLCIPDTWVAALRQAAGKEIGRGPLTRARHWLESRGRSIDLREAVASAVAALAESPSPDWNVLLPLGHWVMHRRTRPDLLTHVLAESREGVRGVPIAEALVADPYVERGESRRRLFPSVLPISSAYLEQDPKGADAHQWRAFFEKAGAVGTLGVRAVETHASRYEAARVASFLGLERAAISESNNDGYTLVDFEIEPDLPNENAPEGIRSALAAWLEDGFSALHDKGRPKASYYYYSRYERTGVRPSNCISRLCELAWVPCEDGELRCPRDVLPRRDPARDESPVAVLTEGLLTALRREGVDFGTAIPEAPALRKLLKVGSTLSAEALADLLRQVREGIDTEQDARHFEEAVRRLTLPSSDGRRISIDRVVRRVGGRLRGALGGWILPLADLREPLREELSRSDFPYEFPDTTTGEQALAYIRDVWLRARSASERLANEVRDVLPAAYGYCLEDAVSNEALAERWKQAVPEAAVFAEREWIALAAAKEPVYFDDIEDRRFFAAETRLRTATGGHLGNSAAQQLETARALGLQPLSSLVEMEWNEGEAISAEGWIPRFRLVCELLHRVRGREQTRDQVEADDEIRATLRLRRVARLELRIRFGEAAPVLVPVNARLQEGVLTVAGRPIEFMSDAAKELLRGFSFRQRGDLAADLTGLLAALDDAAEFGVAADKFVRSYVPGFEVPPEFRHQAGRSEGEARRENAGTEAATDEKHEGERPGPAGTTAGSFDRERALAQQKALAEKLRKALKGELGVDDEIDDSVAPDDGGDGEGTDGELGDEIYREIATRYERLCGRQPELGDPRQEGWDLRSLDPATGVHRLIEVKGKGCRWTDDEVVELSRAQVRGAFRALSEDAPVTWYLYVVERTSQGAYQVLPIENPVKQAGKWILRGQSWRMIAQDPGEVTLGEDLSE